MTETTLRPRDGNGHTPAAPACTDAAAEVACVVEDLAGDIGTLIKIVSHLTDRIAHLESRCDESGIPFHLELMPQPGDSFAFDYSLEHGVNP